MKAFFPYLMVPTLAAAGWGLSILMPQPAALNLPAVLKLDSPPALGVVMHAVVQDQGPVQVRVDALLPAPVPKQRTAPVVTLEPPKVSAILIEGPRKVAHIQGKAMVTGDRYGTYRIVTIESHRVLFEHPALRQKLWVQVNEP